MEARPEREQASGESAAYEGFIRNDSRHREAALRRYHFRYDPNTFPEIVITCVQYGAGELNMRVRADTPGELTEALHFIAEFKPTEDGIRIEAPIAEQAHGS